MNSNNRGRYPPGMGVGRGAVMNANPSFQSRVPQQQYVQRNLMQNHQQFQHQQQQQQHQQQQWLRRSQLPPVDSSVDEVEKTVQSEAVDSRSYTLKHRVDITYFKYTTLYFPEFRSMRLLLLSVFVFVLLECDLMCCWLLLIKKILP